MAIAPTRQRTTRRVTTTTAVVVVPSAHDPDYLFDLLAACKIRVAGYAATVAHALELERVHDPDLIVVGVASNEDVALVRRFRRRLEHAAPVVVVGMGTTESGVQAALELGAATVFCNGPRRPRAARRTSETLSHREVEVLRLASQGLSNNAIARALWISDETVKSHLASTYRKLGARGRHDAAAMATALGYLPQANHQPANVAPIASV